MTESEKPVRINPFIDKIVCSMTGKEHDPQGFSRPIGLCTCCPTPGKPLVVVYKLEAVRDHIVRQGWDEVPGIWKYAPLLPVQGGNQKGTYDT